MEENFEFYKDKNVLITGGAGAIGSRLTNMLLNFNCNIIILDNFSSSYLWNIPRSNKILLINGDITNDIDLKRAFNEKPDIIFHLAAFFANQNSVDYPEKDLKTNGLGTLKLLEYTELYGNVLRFIFAASGCSIYPSDAPMPWTEDLVNTYLSTPYQITKMLGELYCNYFYKIRKIPIIKARFFNSFGPGEVPGQYRNVIPNFIYWSKLGLNLPITGNGEETRDFTYVDDICDVLIRMGYYENVIGEEINIAWSQEIKIKFLAETINHLTGNVKPLIFLPRRNWDTKLRMLASNEKVKKLLNFKPSCTFEEGIKKTITWFDENWEKIKRSADFPPGISSALKYK